MQILLFAVLFGSAFCHPNILPLKLFNSSNTAPVNGIEDSPKLYVASNDDRAILRNIVITILGVNTTVDKLCDYNADGTSKYLNVTGGLFITTTNNDTVTSALTGYIYVTTYAQAKDPSFAVYVITGSHNIGITGMKTTTVILNTNTISDGTDADQPPRSSYVTSIDQGHNTNLYFNWGIPSRDWLEVTNQTFFKNPLMINNLNADGTVNDTATRQFFDHIEPLQINLDYWYIICLGPVNMQIENKFIANNQNYTNTAANTTGLVMNNFVFSTHVVNFQFDETRTSTVGTYISTFLDPHESITFALEDGKSYAGQTYDSGPMVGALATTYFPAKTLTINATSTLPGTFYCQYFGYNGDVLPPTSVPTTLSTLSQSTTAFVSSTTVATTTKSSQSKSFIEILMIGVVVAHFGY